MQVKNNRQIAEKLMGMLDIRMFSNKSNIILTSKINYNQIFPRDVKQMHEEATKLKNTMALSGDHSLSTDKIIMLNLISDLLFPYFSHEDTYLFDWFMDKLALESKVFDVEAFNNNPFIQKIKIDNQRFGDYQLTYFEMTPYELCIFDTSKIIEKYQACIPKIGCFNKTFKYPAIYQESIKSTWMSISPNEVFTMKKPIYNAKGKVLTLGCGMGYFAYMASLKKEVESITIIELEQDVIDLFESYILPQFENRDKIKIIKGDAIEYLKNVKDGEYNYCFADIWIGVEDFEPYFSIKEIGRNFKKTKMEYWIEESFCIYLSSYIFTEILKDFSKSYNVKTDNYNILDDNKENTEMRISNYIKKLFENVKITKPEHIDYYMNPKNISSLIDKTDIIF